MSFSGTRRDSNSGPHTLVVFELNHQTTGATGQIHYRDISDVVLSSTIQENRRFREDIRTPMPHLDVLPCLAAVHPVLHVKPQVFRQVVHEASPRSNDVAVPRRFRLRGHLSGGFSFKFLSIFVISIVATYQVSIMDHFLFLFPIAFSLFFFCRIFANACLVPFSSIFRRHLARKHLHSSGKCRVWYAKTTLKKNTNDCRPEKSTQRRGKGRGGRGTRKGTEERGVVVETAAYTGWTSVTATTSYTSTRGISAPGMLQKKKLSCETENFRPHLNNLSLSTSGHIVTPPNQTNEAS